MKKLGLIMIQGIPTPPSAPANITWVFWVVVVLFAVCAALIILLSKKREDVQVTNEKRATAAEGLVKVRDVQIADYKLQIHKLTQELEDLESENKVIVGIKISELAKFWESKHEIETELDVKASELRRVNNLLKRYEEGEPTRKPRS